MLDFLVLGNIPGTQMQIGFEQIIVFVIAPICIVLSSIAYRQLRKQTSINQEIVQA